MGIVDVDLSNYKSRVGALIPPGDYRVRVEDAELDRATTGNQMINLWLRVIGGAHDGAVIIDRLVLTEKSYFRLVGFMEAIGLPTPRRKLRVNTDHFRGKVLDVNVATGDPYMGRPGKSEVRGYMRATDLNGEAAAAADLDEEPAPEELDSASRGEQGQQGELADQRDTGDLVEEQQESVESYGEIDLDSVDLG